MAVVGVVVVFPVGDPDFGVEQGDPLVHVQALIADPVVEQLDEPVTPWLAGWDLADPDLVLAKLSQCFGDQFGSVVAPDQHRQTTLGNDCLLYTSPSPRDRTRSRMPSSA